MSDARSCVSRPPVSFNARFERVLMPCRMKTAEAALHAARGVLLNRAQRSTLDAKYSEKVLRGAQRCTAEHTNLTASYEVHNFITPELHHFRSSQLMKFRSSQLHKFMTSSLQKFGT